MNAYVAVKIMRFASKFVRMLMHESHVIQLQLLRISAQAALCVR